MFEFPTAAQVYHTALGTQLAGDRQELLALLPAESVELIMTSPPFALLRKKAYGNEEQADYVAWLNGFGRAAYRVLKPSGSFVLDLGGAYERGKPVRSLYNFRVLINFCDSLGYYLAEEFFWFNPAKLPSPIEWANKRKIRAKDAVNTVWWFSKTELPKADVTKVLAPYSEPTARAIQHAFRLICPSSSSNSSPIPGTWCETSSRDQTPPAMSQTNFSGDG